LSKYKPKVSSPIVTDMFSLVMGCPSGVATWSCGVTERYVLVKLLEVGPLHICKCDHGDYDDDCAGNSGAVGYRFAS